MQINKSYAACLSLLIPFVMPGFAIAQNSPTVGRSHGLELSIVNIAKQNNNIIIQFELANQNSGRVYIKDAQGDDSQSAFLASGPHIYPPNSVASIEHCSTVQTCITGSEAQDINTYSYVEPQDTLPFSFQYSTSEPVQQNDMISFTVALAARFTRVGDDPANAGRPEPVRFNFRRIPISQ